MTATTRRRGAAGTGGAVGRPSLWRIFLRQVRHDNRGFWRTPIAAFFTLGFPLLFLVLLGSLTGNSIVPGTDVRLAQFLTPAVAAFAAVTGSFTTLAISLTIDRDTGVLKRLRGSPIPPPAVMAARIVSSLWTSVLATALMVVAGVVFFDVRIIGEKLPAAVLTLLVGIACFAALGVAVAALSPSNEATSAITNATVVPLAFISDIFVIGADLPRWLETVGWLFPLKHFANGLQDTFDPFHEGLGFAWDHLAVMLAWGLAGLLIALWRFRWEPVKGGARPRRVRKRSGSVGPGRTSTAFMDDHHRTVMEVAPPSALRLTLLHVRHNIASVIRTPSSLFFVLVFPSLLLVLFSFVFGDPTLDSRGGIGLLQFAAPALGVFGVATAAYADFAERIAFARDQGVLKRIQGTPTPAPVYMAGHICAILVIGMASLLVTLTVGVVVLDVEIVPRMLGGFTVTALLGIATFAALGLALAGLARNADSVPTIANATLLPLAFFSDIFLIGDPPAWMSAIGSLFPLKHMANAIADCFNPTVAGAGFFWDHLAVMAVWFAAAVVLALRFFSWYPRTGGGSAATSQDQDSTAPSTTGR